MELQEAIVTLDREYLLRLLNDRNTDLNVQYDYGETPLLLCLKQRNNNCEMAMDLINAGCDINIKDRWNYTALHKAVSRHESFEVAVALVKRGMDVNAQDIYGQTPLHEAIKNTILQLFAYNLDNICMLLYYGADVTILCCLNKTALMWAFHRNETLVCEILMNFYDDFSIKDCHGHNTLHYATLNKHYLALDIVRAGTNVNCVSNNGSYAPLQSLAYNNGQLFKLIWHKVDYDIILSCATPFLYTYIDNCNFNDEDWLECLYILLTSSIAEGLVAQCIKFTTSKYLNFTFLSNLIRMFQLKEIEAVDRITILSLCLSLGAEASVRDIIKARRLFGCNGEYQALLYASKGNFGSTATPQSFSYDLGLDNDFSLRRILYFMLKLCRSRNEHLSVYIEQEIVFILKRFSVPNYYRVDAKNIILKIRDVTMRHRIRKQLDEVPSFPSLLELSRNAIHSFVKKNFSLTKLYHFQDTVKNFKLPQSMIDVVLFKEPLH